MILKYSKTLPKLFKICSETVRNLFRNCSVSVSEFIEGMSQFSVKGDKTSKLRCKLPFGISCAESSKSAKDLQHQKGYPSWINSDSGIFISDPPSAVGYDFQ